MQKYIIIFLFFLVSNLQAQTYFPPLTGNTWETTSPATLGWCSNKIDDLYNYLQTTQSKAFIVLKDGKIVLEKYFGTFTQDSLWYWASAGKTVTAFLVGKAQEENVLNINNKTSDYLGTGWTSLPLAKENLITIKNQLTMTTGLSDNPATLDCTTPTCLQYLADAGTRWAYHNAPYTLLDKVIENTTNGTLNAYYTAKLKNTIGMNGGFVQTGSNNVLYTNARSMARFGLMISNGGKWNNNNIMTDTHFFNNMINTSQNINLSYGYLWWLNGKASYMVPGLQDVFQGSLQPDSPNDMYSAIGKNGQILNIIPSSKLVVLRLGNNSDNSLVPFIYNNEIMKRVMNLTCTTPIEQELSNLIQIFPNPTQDYLEININTNLPFMIRITDLLGKQLFETKENCKIDVSNYKKGVYFVEIEQNTKKIRHKIIIL